MGKITKSILEAGSSAELQRIYDKYPTKCRQWNAAFLINRLTPDGVKKSIKKEDAETFDAFTNFAPDAIVATAGTEVMANHWAKETHLTKSIDRFTLENRDSRGNLKGYYIDCHYPGFNVEPFVNRGPEYQVCETETLPDGIYHTMSFGFVERSRGHTRDSNRKEVGGSFKGLSIKKIYSTTELFEVFKKEEEAFEKLANELDKAKTDISEYSKAPETLIEFMDGLFTQEEVSVSEEAKVL